MDARFQHRVRSAPLSGPLRCWTTAALCAIWVGCAGADGPLEPEPSPTASVTWRGLRVEAEHRCSPYDSDDYSYPASLEAEIISELGGIWSPYTGEVFDSARETDIEHIVARSEAHDSGGCAWSVERRREFSRDLLNVTLAAPALNRQEKSGKDAAEWMPRMNRCWFADRVVRVRQAWNLSVDRREADALDDVLAGCTSRALQRP